MSVRLTGGQDITHSNERNIVLTTAYQGTNYSGWQVQDNAPSIQGELEKGLTRLLKKPVRVRGCSRTDAGVHARRHISSFKAETSIPLDRLPLALGTVLPPDIVIRDARYAINSFDPRFDARGKRYDYRIWNHPRPDPFQRLFSYHEPRALDTHAMKRAAALIKGKKDYCTFRAAGFESKTSVRTVFDCQVLQREELITIMIRGDAFLYNMVRIIAGTLLYVGLGMIDAETIPDIIESQERARAGKTLGPQGLFLERVYYPAEVFTEDAIIC